MVSREALPRVLSDAQLQAFISDGFVRIDEAFPRHLADEGRAILWRDLPGDSCDPATWTHPVVRLGWYGDAPFREAVNSPVLHAAFDQLVGRGRWRPRTDLGTFPVRFPSLVDAGDTGWHIDVSFPGPGSSWEERQDFSDWRASITSRGRALLMLFLFSDVGEADAPTRIKAGSHIDIARVLAPAGDSGMSNAMLAEAMATIERPEVAATGPAGTVYLCHPLLVHAAQMHHGTTPRILAQPPLHPGVPLQIERPEGDYSPVEIAIRRALRNEG
ncbi:MAG: phytanoyl-CoA dioxygenase [Bradyrhizobium sp.]|nr:phytanoyl-CoA dioxygenase [Bradyrhizobium sp.]